MWTDLKQHVKRCVKCQRVKSEYQKPAGKHQQVNSLRPNEILGVDIVGPLPRSPHQHEYLLVFIDYFSQWVELFPIRKATAQTVTYLLRKEILTWW